MSVVTIWRKKTSKYFVPWMCINMMSLAYVTNLQPRDTQVIIKIHWSYSLGTIFCTCISIPKVRLHYLQKRKTLSRRKSRYEKVKFPLFCPCRHFYFLQIRSDIREGRWVTHCLLVHSLYLAVSVYNQWAWLQVAVPTECSCSVGFLRCAV